MGNRALKLFPNTCRVLKILKFSCFLRGKKGLNQGIPWHSTKAHNTKIRVHNRQPKYPSIQGGAGVTPSLACTSSHLQTGVLTLGRGDKHSAVQALQLAHCKGRGSSSCCLQYPCSQPSPPTARPPLQHLPSSPSSTYGTKEQKRFRGPHINSGNLPSNPHCWQGWATTTKPHPRISPCVLWIYNTFHFQPTPL